MPGRALRVAPCVLVACGRVGFGLGPDAAPPGDGREQDAAPVCSQFGPFGTPENLAAINTPNDERGPALSSDELAIYFDSDAGASGRDLFVATRADRGAPWSAPVLLASVNSSNADMVPWLDGDVLYFSSGRSVSSDIFTAGRADATTFQVPVVLAGFDDAAFDEHAPALSPDGLTMYYSYGPRGMEADLHVATRATRADLFTPAGPIPSINSNTVDRNPSVSRDGLELFFDSRRDGSDRIYVARRTSTADSFGPPAPVTELNDGTAHQTPRLSADGATVYFASDRQGTLGGLDLWTATRVCISP